VKQVHQEIKDFQETHLEIQVIKDYKVLLVLKDLRALVEDKVQ
jgi:hypothetical protein